jgi:CheY-like chemotaxis protein
VEKRILIVDDDELPRSALAAMLSSRGYTVTDVESGEEALAAVAGNGYDLVITDVMMPGMNGVDLLKAIKEERPALPVIMISGKANMEVTIEALRAGAINFVRKPYDDTEIVGIIERSVLASIRARDVQMVMPYVQEHKKIVLPSRVAYIRGAVSYLTNGLDLLGLFGPATAQKIILALDEALSNAVEHGNLEVPSHSKADVEGMESYRRLVASREADPRYGERTVTVESSIGRGELRVTVTDQGPGFEHADLPDPRDPANLFRTHGRGILLIKLSMDEVHFNEKGNSITMVKRAETP